MIDGVKILCNLNPSDWTNNKNLSFRAWADLATGEAPHNSTHAEIKGLRLSIVLGDTGTFCNLRGSLPKYFNNGENNAFDYDYSNFLTTCDQLAGELKIKPNNAILRGFEFGVNVSLPVPVREVLENIKAYKKHTFGQYTEKGKGLGLVFDFQQYRVKIYDKGHQQTGKPSQLMRFEIGVKKMAFVKNLEIKTLADLQNKSVWAGLSGILLSVWRDIVYLEKGLKYKLMKAHQQKKYLYFFNPLYWIDLNKKQYHTARQTLSKLRAKYGNGNDTKAIINELIYSQCLKLATESTPEKGNDLTEWNKLKNAFGISESVQPLENQKRERFNHLDKGIIQVNNSNTYLLENTSKKILNDRKEKSKKKKPKKSICMNCKKELKNKKASVKFCGLKCKNHHNGKRRTQARQKQRANELRELKKLFPKLKGLDLPLLVIYKADGMQYADHLSQSEINAPAEWIRQIVKVLITDNKTAPPVCFTTLRAKRLIKEITNINKQKL